MKSALCVTRRFFPLLLLACSVIAASNAQSVAAESPQGISKDVIDYSLLFRRVAEFKELSDQAQASHQDEIPTRFIVAQNLGLNLEEGIVLEDVSIRYRDEVRAIQTQVVEVVSNLRSTSRKSEAATLSNPELIDLQRQKDALALRYRDEIHSRLGEEEFQRLDNSVHDKFSHQYHATVAEAIQP